VASPRTFDSASREPGSQAISRGYLKSTVRNFDITKGGHGRNPSLIFDLQSISVVTRTAALLALTGSGVFLAPGFDNTRATFVFSGQGDGTFTFLATQGAVVPEPTTLLLLGGGLTALVGLGAIRRRRRG
jgi:hypothetical protein